MESDNKIMHQWDTRVLRLERQVKDIITKRLNAELCLALNKTREDIDGCEPLPAGWLHSDITFIFNDTCDDLYNNKQVHVQLKTNSWEYSFYASDPRSKLVPYCL